MEYLEVQNWKEHQHYGKRNPPWIKLYSKLLDNYDYGCLPDDSKILLVSLYLLASKTNNQIPNDIEWIRSRSALKGKIHLYPLIKANFIKVLSNGNGDASTVLAQGYQDESKMLVSEETETETDF